MLGRTTAPACGSQSEIFACAKIFLLTHRVALLGIVDQAMTCVVRLVIIPILLATRATGGFVQRFLKLRRFLRAHQ